MIYGLVIIILSVVGLLASNKIRVNKNVEIQNSAAIEKNKSVTTSNFSKFLGVPNEYAGIVYYSAIIIISIILLIKQGLGNSFLQIVFYGLTTFGFLFSVYLVLVQATILKSYCKLCLISATTSTLIFATILTKVFLNFDATVLLLSQNALFILFVSVIGYALGTSIATVTDILTFKFLKDFSLDPKEKAGLMYLWQGIWCSIAIVAISSFGLIISESQTIIDPGLFKAKTLIFSFIILNSIVLSAFVLPFLAISRLEKKVIHVVKVSFYRYLAFLLTTLSVLSWYTTLFIGILLPYRNDVREVFQSYGLILLAGLLLSIVIVKIYDKKMSRQYSIKKS